MFRQILGKMLNKKTIEIVDRLFRQFPKFFLSIPKFHALDKLLRKTYELIKFRELTVHNIQLRLITCRQIFVLTLKIAIIWRDNFILLQMQSLKVCFNSTQ